MTQIIGLGGQKNVNFTNWDINQQYRPGDMVVYNSTIYTVTTNIPAGTPFGPEWSIAVVGGNVNFAEDANVANVANVALAVDGPNVTGEVANAAFATNAANAVFADDAGNAAFANSSAALDAAGASDVKIGGGLLGQVLKSDGAGNMVWAADTATPAVPDTSVQFNSGGSFGGDASFTFAGGIVTLPAATVTGVTNLGAVANVKITGGNAGEFLQTDGTGNVTWTSSSATLPIANGTSQFDIPTADSDVVITANTAYDFTFGADGNLTVPGTILPDANVSYDLGSATNRFRDLYLSNNTIYLGSDTISANAGNVTFSGNLVATRLYGESTTSITTGTVTTNAQPNITSVGTLTSLDVTGNITTNSGVFIGDAYGLANLQGANVTGIVANANYTVYSETSLEIANGTSGIAIPVANSNIQISVNGTMIIDASDVQTSFLSNTISVNYDLNAGNRVYANSLEAGGAITASTIEAYSSITTAFFTATLGASFYDYASVGANLSVGTTLDVTDDANIGGILTTADLVVSNVANLGNVANITIEGGNAGEYLQTDGAGNLIWTTAGGGGGTPAGANTEIQFNDAGAFGANSTFTFNKTTGLVTVQDLAVTGNVTTALLPDANVTYDLGSATQRWKDLYLSNNTIYMGDDTISANAGNVTFSGTLVSTRLYGEASTAITAATVTDNAQANITSVGTLISLEVTVNTDSGNLNTGGTVIATGNITGGNIDTAGEVTATGNITGANLITSGNLEVTGQANASAFNTTLTTEQSSLNGSRMTVTVPATSTEAPTGTPTTIYTPTAGVYSYKVIVTIKHDTGGSIDIETFEVMASNGATDMLFSVSNRLNTLGSNGGLNDAEVTIGNGFELSIDTKYGDTNTVTFAVTEFK